MKSKETKARLAIIGTVGVPGKYGGFETLAHHLVLQLADRYDITVYNSKPAYPPEERRQEWQGARIVWLPLKANGPQSILYDILSMLHALFTADVLLVLGVSGCIFLPFLKLVSRKRIIVNVDGLEWRRAKWKGWIRRFLMFSEALAIRYADEIITDNEAIQKYVLNRYGCSSRLVAYGADHARPVPRDPALYDRFPFLSGKYAFKVCRIEPENNVHVVLDAFARQQELPLVIVGNWDHSEYGRSLRARFGHEPHIHLLDPIYDPHLLNMLRSNAWLYVHGHSAGGTNPSLVEAMYLGLPVLAYDVIYNRVTTHGKARYFADADDLFALLQNLQPAELRDLAREMKAIAENCYTWHWIARQYAEAAKGEERLGVPVFSFELPPALRQTFL